MAVMNPPAWMQQGSYTAQKDRLAISDFIQTGGVTSLASLLVTAMGTPSMQTSISAGSAYVFGTQQARQGVYHVVNDGPVTVTHGPSNSTNARIDLIVLRIYDASISGAISEARIEIVPGTPASTPSAPGLPVSSIELARVTVGAGVTSITSGSINTTLRNVATMNNYMIERGWVSSNTDPGHKDGWTWYQPSSKLTRISNGTSWTVTGKPAMTPVALEAGWVYVSGHGMQVGAADGLARLRGARVVRQSTSFQIVGNTDHGLGEPIPADCRPAVVQEVVGTIYT